MNWVNYLKLQYAYVSMYLYYMTMNLKQYLYARHNKE